MKEQLTRPARIWSRDEVLAKPSPVPREPGLYAWYFKAIPPGVPTRDCVTHGEFTLLYAGISPAAPSKSTGRVSKQRLWNRVRSHYRANASRSTLRFSLGCLLAPTLEIELQHVQGRFHLGKEGEARLSEWMGENAFVTWSIHPQPWEAESELIQTVSLPLNLDQNREHPFHTSLSSTRKKARERAVQRSQV